MNHRTVLAQDIAAAFVAAFPGVEPPADIQADIATPPNPDLGDFAYPCFKLAKVLRKAPPMIAQTLAQALRAPYIARVAADGGYLNIALDRAQFARETLLAVRDSRGRYGSGNEGAGKVICIDYSSINISKRFHIGHLFTTMIGNALKNLHEFRGYRTVGINHLGDWGTQFGTLLAAYKRWGNREAIEKDGIDEMTRLYVRFHAEAQNDAALEAEGREWFRRIEQGDAEALELFYWFRDITLADCQRVYDMLGVSFDHFTGESFYCLNGLVDKALDELREKNLLELSEGAYVVKVGDDVPPCILLKKDGATLYHSRDIAAAIYRKQTYGFDKCLYVVASHQTLHFTQLFRVMARMGYEWSREMIHVSYGMVSYEGEALSTRRGHVVILEDFLNQAVQKARDIIEEKSPQLTTKDEAARQVGVGSVVFYSLLNNRIKDVDFWWDRALNFDGETAPYVQYTHARCCSVLRKADEQALPEAEPDYGALSDPEAFAVLTALARFPDAITDALDRYEPYLVTRHIIDLAQAYNKFYYEHRILEETEAVRAARLALTRAVRDVIRTGLALIGVQAPERM